MVDICLTFLLCRNRRAFSFQLENLDELSSLRHIVKSFDETRLKEQSRIKFKQKGGKA